MQLLQPNQPAQPAQPIQARDLERVSRASQELGNLEARRAELKSQLQSLTERRVNLSMQLSTADGSAKNALEARLRDVDDRTGRVSDELNAIDDQVNALLKRGVNAPPSAFDRLMEHATTTTPPPMPFEFSQSRGDNRILLNLMIGQAVSFVLLALILWRGLRRRVSSMMRLAPEDANRLEQLQRSVDVMAVEVERISEGQRYVAKVLNDPALGVGERVKSATDSG